MIDPMKWEQMTDEQKLQMCKSIKEGANIGTVTKADWKLMFEFLLDKVQGQFKVGFKVNLLYLEPIQSQQCCGFVGHWFKVVQGEFNLFYRN